MTPSTLEVLVRCHIYGSANEMLNSPTVKKALEQLMHHGLLEQISGEFGTTARGKAHVDQLCALPFPEQVYIDYKGDKL